MSAQNDVDPLVKEELLEKDRKYVWHHMSAHNENPMIIASGEGSWVTDIDGNRYLDGMSGLWCVNVGHGRREIAEAAADQMMKIAYATLVQSHIPAIELAAKLNEWLEGSTAFFTLIRDQTLMKSPSKSPVNIIIRMENRVNISLSRVIERIMETPWVHWEQRVKRNVS